MAQGSYPDVALLDLVLRDGPCLEVARILQERNVPIVFLSGQMRDDTLPDDLQGLPWIEKPVRFEQLLGVLDQAANEKIHEQRVSRNLGDGCMTGR